MGERIGTLIRDLDRSDSTSSSKLVDPSFERERLRVLTILNLAKEREQDKKLSLSSHLGFLPRNRLGRSVEFCMVYILYIIHRILLLFSSICCLFIYCFMCMI